MQLVRCGVVGWVSRWDGISDYVGLAGFSVVTSSVPVVCQHLVLHPQPGAIDVDSLCSKPLSG